MALLFQLAQALNRLKGKTVMANVIQKKENSVRGVIATARKTSTPMTVSTPSRPGTVTSARLDELILQLRDGLARHRDAERSREQVVHRHFPRDRRPAERGRPGEHHARRRRRGRGSESGKRAGELPRAGGAGDRGEEGE